MPKRIKFCVFRDAQLDGLRFVSDLVDLNCAMDEVGSCRVNLHVEELRILGNHFVTIAVRIETFLSVVDFPVH